MRFMVAIAVTAGVLLAGAGSAAAATTRYASPSGGGDCSSRASACSMAEANAASAAGDTISLARGDFRSLGDVSITPGVIVVGARPYGPPRANSFVPAGASVLLVDKLTLAGGALRDVTVIGTTSGSVLAADGTAIERVIADGEGGSPASICTFSGLVARNSVCQASPGGAAVTITGSGASELRNVTADAGYSADGADGIVVSGPARLLVHNTSASGATSLVVTDPGAAVAVDHSQYSELSAPPGTVTLGPGNIDFLFHPRLGHHNCPEDGRDGYADQPANGSKVVDAGGDVDPGETDVLGQPRARGAAPDIGAYEYQPSQPCVSRTRVYPIDGDIVDGLLVDTGVNPHGAATTVAFQWGPTTAYGAPAHSWSGFDGTLAVSLFQVFSELDAGVTYHFRVVATNDYGTAYGPDVTFTMPAPPSPPPSSPAPSAARPKVRIGLPSAKRCRASRKLALRPRIANGGTITAVSVYVRGKLRLRVTGARARRTIRIKRLPAGRYTIGVRVRTKDGRIVKAKRTYRRCKKAQ